MSLKIILSLPLYEADEGNFSSSLAASSLPFELNVLTPYKTMGSTGVITSYTQNNLILRALFWRVKSAWHAYLVRLLVREPAHLGKTLGMLNAYEGKSSNCVLIEY